MLPANILRFDLRRPCDGYDPVTERGELRIALDRSLQLLPEIEHGIREKAEDDDLALLPRVLLVDRLLFCFASDRLERFDDRAELRVDFRRDRPQPVFQLAKDGQVILDIAA